jgi:acylphosphatase
MDTTSLSRLHVYINGRVQGVGFRNYAITKANLLGLTGWVRNAGEERVEVMAEGEMAMLITYLEYLRRGPRTALITHVEQSWERATGEFAYFDIRYSV